MNQIPIPKEFFLFGEKHKVKLQKKVDKGQALGSWDPENNSIKLEKASKTRNQDQVEQTYIHEVVHCILDHLSYEHLSHDEKFVDVFAKALAQVLKTAKY